MRKLTYKKLTFEDLDGWDADDHLSAFDVFKTTCGELLAAGDLAKLDLVRGAQDARRYFEDVFTPILIEDGQQMLFTGYFEPEFLGSRTRSDEYQYPIYSVPADLDRDTPYFSRQEIEKGELFADRGLEIAWLTDPADRFFLQVQGSGRIRLPDNTVMRVGYAAKNGHAYTSIGKLLIQRKVFKQDEISASIVREWIARNPEEGRALLWENESYVFFKEIVNLTECSGPIGTMNEPITDLRSIAVDPDIVPLGSPVWVEKRGLAPLKCLTVAQDTGSAIKGSHRADIFFGTGAAAGEIAGQTNDHGRMVVLMPTEIASSLLAGQS